ncbi:MAG: hypothetical protein RR560_04200 [Hydrogenoanaerobacterium sp.]
MSVFTKFLKLFEYENEKDSAKNFNITEALNNNWNKLDAAAEKDSAAIAALQSTKADKTAVSEELSHKANQEVGSWTPVLAGMSTAGNFVYSRQYGKYIKIGNVVTISCDLAISNVLQVPVGDVILTGLPFATSWQNQSATVGYVKGGYGETMRKISQGSIIDVMISLRGILPAVFADGVQTNGLTALTFADNTSNNCIKINTGANDIVLFIGATYII